MEVGQVGDVGAEVVAAGAAEPERAGAASGVDVGRFGADTERDGEFEGLERGPPAFQCRNISTKSVTFHDLLATQGPFQDP